METTTTFVLGILCGSFLLGIVYGVIGMLNMKKSQKQLQATVTNLQQEQDQLHHRIDEVLKDLDKQQVENQRDLDTRFNELHQVSDENRKYTDSRIDKTSDVLCQRMDILLNEGLKAYHGLEKQVPNK
jgi:hypothetical protein